MAERAELMDVAEWLREYLASVELPVWSSRFGPYGGRYEICLRGDKYEVILYRNRWICVEMRITDIGRNCLKGAVISIPDELLRGFVSGPKDLVRMMFGNSFRRLVWELKGWTNEN